MCNASREGAKKFWRSVKMIEVGGGAEAVQLNGLANSKKLKKKKYCLVEMKGWR